MVLDGWGRDAKEIRRKEGGAKAPADQRRYSLYPLGFTAHIASPRMSKSHDPRHIGVVPARPSIASSEGGCLPSRARNGQERRAIRRRCNVSFLTTCTIGQRRNRTL